LFDEENAPSFNGVSFTFNDGTSHFQHSLYLLLAFVDIDVLLLKGKGCVVDTKLLASQKHENGKAN